MGREQTYTIVQIKEGECQASQHKEGVSVRAKFEFVDQGVYINFANEEPVLFEKVNDAAEDHVYERSYLVLLGTEAYEQLTLDSDGRGFTIVNTNIYSMLGKRHCITREYKQG